MWRVHLKLAEQRLLENSRRKQEAASAAAAVRFVSRLLAFHICQLAFGGPVYFLYNPSIHFLGQRWSRPWLPLGAEVPSWTSHVNLRSQPNI